MGIMDSTKQFFVTKIFVSLLSFFESNCALDQLFPKMKFFFLSALLHLDLKHRKLKYEFFQKTKHKPAICGHFGLCVRPPPDG